MSSTRSQARQPGRWVRMRQNLGGEMMAEFLGTFVLVLLGCGSVAVALVGLPGSGRQTGDFGPANWLIIAWGWGLAVTFGVYVAGGVTGAHINPAVTLAWAVRKTFAWRKVVPYWVAQTLGGFAGGAVVYSTYHQAIDMYLANNAPGTREGSVDTFSIFATFPAEYFGNSTWAPLLAQMVGTAVLAGLIAAVIDKRNTATGANLGPYVIGLIVAVIGLSYGTSAGYAINPARDFGPRLVTFLAGWGETAFPGNTDWFTGYWWIPIVGPLIGGVLGAIVYDQFIGNVLKLRETAPESRRIPENPEESVVTN